MKYLAQLNTQCGLRKKIEKIFKPKFSTQTNFESFFLELKNNNNVNYKKVFSIDKDKIQCWPSL